MEGHDDASLRHRLGRTALFIAAGRAVDTEREKPLITDEWARALAGDEGFEFLDNVAAKLSGRDMACRIVAIRTKFFDDAALRLCHREHDPVRQVVLLGSGLDTRAYRLDWPTGVSVYEVDFEEVFKYKRGILHRLSAEAKCEQLIDVAADLRDEGWAEALETKGFDRTKASCWLLEGLLAYFEKAEVHRLLHTIAQLCTAGSEADVFNDPTVHHPITQAYGEAWAAYSSSMKWTCNDPVHLFQMHGFSAQCCRYGDDGCNFGHYPESKAALVKALAKDSNVLPVTRVTRAVRGERPISDIAPVISQEIELAVLEDMLETAKQIGGEESDLVALQEDVKQKEIAVLGQLAGGIDDLD